MKRTMAWLTGSLLALAAVPAFAGMATQIWHCEMHDDATEEQFLEHATEWAAAARKLPGGEKMKFSVHFPVAVQHVGETDILIIMTLPTFADWGKFWDVYPDSDAAQLEGRSVDCTVSSVWEEKVID
ncbi:MAG: hypothetical protein PVG22_05455 [Chromatiales bacterium]